MCGLAGIIGDTEPLDLSIVEQMLNAIQHRGPDARGILQVPEASFGHVRLSIVDLTDAGSQPMVSPQGNILLFNGMIYNYQELRSELSSRYNFLSQSDSEVLLAALEVWGIGCIEKLNGMFAFCWFECKTKNTYLARDRFGQKPLYYSLKKGRLFFSSEIKSLLTAGVSSEPNQRQWFGYMTRGESDASDQTYFAQVFQVKPSEYILFTPKKQVVKKVYYSVPTQIKYFPSDAPLVFERLYELLENVTRLHMRADVEIGVMLSGGFDSSALLALIANTESLRDQTSCFSVEFSDEFSEKEWIEKAVGHYELGSHYVNLTPSFCVDEFAREIYSLEGPSGGIMNFGLSKLMETISQNSVKVVHDGTGLDEAFGGYDNHHALFLKNLFCKKHPDYESYLAAYAGCRSIELTIAHDFIKNFRPDEQKAIDGTSPFRNDLFNLDDFIPTNMSFNDSKFHDDYVVNNALKNYLIRDKIPRNTRMKDRASMALGIELRLPFLDHRLVEFGLAMHPALFFGCGRTKSVLRSAMHLHMDDEVRLATKRSIQSPQALWLRNEPFKSFIGDLIHSKSFQERGFFKVPDVIDAFSHFCQHGAVNSFFVWQWINYEMMHRVYHDH
jgi:asparagine synthase (glutamine-hydrolysing)